jgi:hypothetical protein
MATTIVRRLLVDGQVWLQRHIEGVNERVILLLSVDHPKRRSKPRHRSLPNAAKTTA